MMLSERLEVIKILLNRDEEKSIKVIAELEKLRLDDVITATLLSRKACISINESTKILAMLVEMKELEYFIIVNCINPYLKSANETEHYKYFSTLREYNNFSKNRECTICGCGYEYDLDNAKIGFKIFMEKQ